MPGNNKRKRKPTPKGIGTPERMKERMVTGLIERRKRKDAIRARNVRLSLLPMGHPANAYILDMTFDPIYKMFDEFEKTGGHLFDPDGMAVMWVERDGCFTPLVDACFELHAQFEFTAAERDWGDVPPGLMAYGAKIARGERISEDDQRDARATVDWMREQLRGINCYDWSHSMTRMEAQKQHQVQA